MNAPMRHRGLALGVFVGGLLPGAGLDAKPIAYVLSGSVDSISTDGAVRNRVPPALELALFDETSTWSATITLDDDEAAYDETEISSRGVMGYISSPGSPMDITVYLQFAGGGGVYVFSVPAEGDLEFWVGNDIAETNFPFSLEPIPGGDLLTVSSWVTSGLGNVPWDSQFMTLFLRDPTASAFSAETIPESLDVADFDYKSFHVTFTTADGFALKHLQLLVDDISVVSIPEPSAGALAALGGVGLLTRGGCRRWSRRNRQDIRKMSSSRWAVVLSAVLFSPSPAQAAIIETVPVGNAGNAADTEVMTDGTTGYGDVAYEYRIGKYEVTNAQYAEFLNTVDPTGANALHLYSGGMSNRPEGGINFEAAASNGSKYSLKSGFGNRPVIYVSWYGALRFTNWLHNGQGSGDTENGAYTLMGMLDSSNDEVKGATITRNPGARWFLPSEDEWYKAAYHKNDGITGNFWDYPTGTDVAPTAEAPPGGDNSANFSGVIDTVSDVGAYTKSFSSYGTFDQGGNLYEWNESLTIKRDRFNVKDNYFRGLRGGGWFGEGAVYPQVLAASNRPAIGGEGGSNPGGRSIHWGFRVASIPNPIPEPCSLLLAAFAAVTLSRRNRTFGYWFKRRRQPIFLEKFT